MVQSHFVIKQTGAKVATWDGSRFPPLSLRNIATRHQHRSTHLINTRHGGGIYQGEAGTTPRGGEGEIARSQRVCSVDDWLMVQTKMLLTKNPCLSLSLSTRSNLSVALHLVRDYFAYKMLLPSCKLKISRRPADNIKIILESCASILRST